METKLKTDISSKVLETASSAELLKTERLALTALRPNPRNPKTHPKRQKKLLKASIEHFGQIKPVIIDENNVIIAGYATAEAARAAGLTSVYVIRCGHLTEAQKRAYQIIDGKFIDPLTIATRKQFDHPGFDPRSAHRRVKKRRRLRTG
jgi:hypothetical protein